MADPRMQRRVPEDYRFCPTEKKLVDHYLRHKLMDPDDSICEIIPEIDVCENEPWKIRELAALAFPEMEEDDPECYFFHECGYGARFERTTPAGSWKVAGPDRLIKARDTGKNIGKMKILVYHARRAPDRTIQGNCKWVIHEYHYVAEDDEIPPEKRRTYVACKLIKKTIDFEHESKKHYLSNKDTIDSMIQDYLCEDEGLITPAVGSNHG